MQTNTRELQDIASLERESRAERKAIKSSCCSATEDTDEDDYYKPGIIDYSKYLSKR